MKNGKKQNTMMEIYNINHIKNMKEEKKEY